MKQLLWAVSVAVLLPPVGARAHAQLILLPETDQRSVSLHCSVPATPDLLDSVIVEQSLAPPASLADWSTNLSLTLAAPYDPNLVAEAEAFHDSTLSGQRLGGFLGAFGRVMYGIGIPPAGYAEARSRFAVSFQVAAPTPCQLTSSMPNILGAQSFALWSDVSGTLVEAGYPPVEWLEFSAILQPGEVYTLEAQASDTSNNAGPGIIDVQLWVVVEPPLPGDVSGDGYLSMEDFTLAMKIAVGQREPTDVELAAGDLNRNRILDKDDAHLILRMIRDLRRDR